MSAVTWVDGERCESIAADDRGFLLADGAFETLRWSGVGVYRRDGHLARLIAGLSALFFEHPVQCAAMVFEQLDNALKDMPTGASGVARITVTRGSGPRGYTPPSPARPRIVIVLFADHVVSAAPAQLIVAQTRWATQPQLAGHKLLSRTEQVLAAAEARQAGVIDALMLGQDGSVISTVTGNIFVRNGDTLKTPCLHKAGISGTRRAAILNGLAGLLGLSVHVQDLTLEDVLCADEAFTTNSVLGVRPIAKLRASTWSSFPVAEQLASIIHGDPL